MSGTSAPAGATGAVRPVLLTSPTSAALLDGRGDLTLPRETRGTVLDWGGVYGQLVRLTGPWTVRLARGPRGSDLPATWVGGEGIPGGWRTHHRWEGLELTQEVVPIPIPSGVARRVRIASTVEDAVPLEVTGVFAPYLLPVLVEGIRPVEFRVAATPEGVRVRQEGFALHARARGPPSSVTVNGDQLGRVEYRGPVRSIEFVHRLEVPPRGQTELSWQIAGGVGRDLEAAELEVDPPFVDSDAVGLRLDEADRRWLAESPEMELPDAPELVTAYRSARAAMRQLYTFPGEGLTGMVAGYPWYSSVWCRDLAVMLPAVLWLGDLDWVERSLSSVFRYQSHHRIPVLGGEPGELPMQVTPGPLFLYGTSDSTLRFPAVVEQFHRHAGDRGSVGEWADALHRIVEWGRHRVDPATGWFRHGGEAEAIGAATEYLSRVQYGIDSPDTTIWDSADRRDHAIDVQVLWWSTLSAAGRLLLHAGDAPRSHACADEADRLARALPSRYFPPGADYPFDSFREGAPVPRVRPNALRLVSAGLVDKATASRIVRRAARNDLTTAWGVRTLASSDPAYDPQAYHGGQVWTIATSWAADAAFAAGETELGVQYLRTIADRYAAEAGLANECYRGDRAEPFNSCFLLGFSVAPFLCVLFERLWGIQIDALKGRLRVMPQFPSTWGSARLRNVRVGNGRVDLQWRRGALWVAWSGTQPLTIETSSGASPVRPGETIEVETREQA